MQAFLSFFLFSLCACQKGSWSQAFQAETMVSAGDKNGEVSQRHAL